MKTKSKYMGSLLQNEKITEGIKMEDDWKEIIAQ